jgi:hypothetical protein
VCDRGCRIFLSAGATNKKPLPAHGLATLCDGGDYSTLAVLFSIDHDSEIYFFVFASCLGEEIFGARDITNGPQHQVSSSPGTVGEWCSWLGADVLCAVIQYPVWPVSDLVHSCGIRCLALSLKPFASLSHLPSTSPLFRLFSLR